MEQEEDSIHHLVPGENQDGWIFSLHHHVLFRRLHQKGDGTTEV